METAQKNGTGLSLVSPFTEVEPDPQSTIHPTAIVESGVSIGAGTSVWDNVHIRENATVGEDCIIGEKSYIAYDVTIGNCVKINSGVYIPTGVTIGDGVMVSAGVIFANDRYPRAATSDLKQLRPSEPDGETLTTWVHGGATIGAGAMLVGGIEIGAFAMVGMGSVVTKPVPAFHMVAGNPARSIGTVCRCGRPTTRLTGALPSGPNEVVQCQGCGMRYQVRGNQVIEFNPPIAVVPRAPAPAPASENNVPPAAD